MTDIQLIAEIRTARERTNHFKQYRNEPSGKKKLGHWRRRLKKAVKNATKRGLTVPKDPFAPPPPPPPEPTETELHAAAVKEAKMRVSFEWQATVGHPYWAPWGKSGWSAVVLTELKRVWCSAYRVNPSSQATTATKARVRRDRLVKRDPALKGKDRPPEGPEIVAPKPGPMWEPAAPEPEPAVVAPTKPTEPERSPEEQMDRAKKVADLFELTDSNTSDDW
jgi:hypothetical protein